MIYGTKKQLAKKVRWKKILKETNLTLNIKKKKKDKNNYRILELSLKCDCIFVTETG